MTQLSYYITIRFRLGVPNIIYTSACNHIPPQEKLEKLGDFGSPFQAIKAAKIKGYGKISVCQCNKCQLG